MLTMRRVTKATELKRFKELEGEYHYMGEPHSGGDTMRFVFEEDGKWTESRFGHLMAEWTRTPHGDAHALRQNPKRRPC